MKRFYEDKIVPIGQPSQRRWVSRALGPVHTCVCVFTVSGNQPHEPMGTEQCTYVVVCQACRFRSSLEGHELRKLWAAVCAHSGAQQLAPEVGAREQGAQQ